MKPKEEIQSRINEFSALCRSHKVRSLYVFGSAASGRFDEELSDIDLLVNIDVDDPIERGEKLLSLWEKLEQFFHRKVDLLTDASVRNPVLRNKIDSTKILIYDGRGQQVFI